MTQTVPKPMIPVHGKPFLEHEVVLLRDRGIEDFVFCIGYLGEKVEGYFGDGGRWGINVRYSRDGPKLMGPIGALKSAEPLLEERFFVTYGDAYLRADYGGIMKALIESKRLAVMAVYENRNRYGKSDVVVRGDKVVRYDKKSPGAGMDWVNFGVSALRRSALDIVPAGTECGEEQFYGELIKRDELLAFPVQDRFYEIGTPDSLNEFEQFMGSRR
jgi:N-acetyl-alpha-D-muramate 1-phosphate uridylyltransferase